MPRAFKVLLLLVVVALLSSVGFGYSVVHQARAKSAGITAAQDADAERYRARIEADTARWKHDPLFAPHEGGDAAALLFAHVRWEKDTVRPDPAPPVVSAAFKTWGLDWPRHAAELELSGVDLAWMSQLEHFGFWDLEGPDSPGHDLPFEPVTETIPNFVDAQLLGKLRLAQGLQSGGPVRAAAEVRQLARLCLSSESLVGEMIGVALLGIERRVHEEAVRRGLPVDGWTPISEEDQASLQRVLWVAPASFDLLASEALAARRPAIGDCAGLREGLNLAFYLDGYLREELPARYESLGRALADPRCRLRRLRAAWGLSGQKGQLPVGAGACPPGTETAQNPACAAPGPLGRLPLLRAYLAQMLVATATPDWFRRYRSDGTPPGS